MLFRFIINLLLFLCPGLLLYGQEYNITNFNTDNGLPQNSIAAINFDNAGYCWLGTEMGLVRFDGVHFKIFDSDNIRSLKSDRVRVIAKDTSGNTYVDYNNSQQFPIKMPGTGYANAPSPAAHQGQYMLLSVPNQLAVAFPAKLQQSLLSYFKSGGAENFGIATKSGSVYFVVKNKTYYYLHGQMEVIDAASQDYDRTHAIVNDRLVLLLPSGKVKTWIKDTLQTGFKSITGPISRDNNYISGNYRLMYSATGAYIYAGRTIYEIYFEGGQLKSKKVLDGISIPNICTIYYNKLQGKYYIGSLTAGLYIISFPVFHYPQIPAQAIEDGFRTQAPVQGGEGIICERYIYNRNDSCTMLPISRHIGATVYTDAGNNIYYGMTASLFKFSPVTRRSRKLLDLNSRPCSIISDKRDSNCILLCTSLSIGKIYHDSLTVMQKVPGREKDKAIWSLTQTGRDSFLLGTQEGLKWYDFTHNKIFRSILDSFSIHNVYVETANRIWVSTDGKGFFLYMDGKLHSLPLGPFSALKTVHAFVDDGNGNFWLPTNNGLYKVSKTALLDYVTGKTKDVYYYSFSTRNGLRTNEFNGGSVPSYVWLNGNMLSLLSIQGPVWFCPNKARILLPREPIYFDKLAVSGKEMDITKGRKIVLPPDFDQLSLIVSSPYFGNPENMRMEYRIEGLNNIWKSIPESGEIMINQLPSGNYNLAIRKLAGFSPGDFVVTSLKITVRPYFYNTWPFYSVVLLFMLILIWVSIYLRTMLLKMRNRNLKLQVAMQTRGLNQTIRQLARSEEALKQSNQTKDDIITTVLHDLRSPIRFAHMITSRLVSDFAHMDMATLKMQLVELKNSTASLGNFTEQFFTWAISHHQSFSARPSRIPLQDIFNELETLYKDIIKANGNMLIVDDTSITCYTDRQLLSTIIRNLLDNANKNTRYGTITLKAARENDCIVITVNDTGKGFEPEQLQSFLDKEKYNPRKEGTGSLIIMQLMDFLKGALEATSTPGKGTSFRIILPATIP